MLILCIVPVLMFGTCFMSFTLSAKAKIFGSFQPVRRLARRDYSMKMETLNKRLDRNRPMTSVTIRMPEDVIEDLKKVAPLLGFSVYQPLIRAYIGQCLRVDLERFENETVNALVESLKRRGVSEAVIGEALDEVAHAAAN
jgi:predicted DNA binding CopG/RHH family protein